MTMNDKSAKQILIDARQSVIDNGLTTGTLVEYKPGTKDLCFCLLGHIAYAAGIPVTVDYEGRAIFAMKNTYTILNSMEAVRKLAEEIEPDCYQKPPIQVIYDYNDRWADYSDCHIIEVFDKAIAAYD